MGIHATFQTLIEVIVFAIPVALVLTLVFLWWSSRRYRRGALPPSTDKAGVPFHAVSQPSSDQVPAPAVFETPEAITAKIESADASGEKTKLATLYLELAAAYARDGNLDARMAALRSAAGCGALHGPHAAHAAARLALGEAAHEAGDLIGACEQWQMARTAYLEGGHAKQHEQVEKRMRDNGCPTDWVLTDF